MLVKKLFSKIIVCALGVILVLPGASAATNIPSASGDISDYGAWTTPHNLESFTTDLSQDIDFFQSDFQNQLVENYVPVEAKIGLAFINAMTYLGRILDSSLVRFATIFIAIAFMFLSLINNSEPTRR